MILIAGLGKYYGEKRRDYFEFTILNSFNAYHEALRSLLFEAFLYHHRDLNNELYDFTLCFEPGKAATPFCKTGERARS
jgi:hypothetical protein